MNKGLDYSLYKYRSKNLNKNESLKEINTFKKGKI